MYDMAIGIYAWKWMEGKLVYHLRKMARRDSALPVAPCRILGYTKQYFTMPVFTISPSL